LITIEQARLAKAEAKRRLGTEPATIGITKTKGGYAVRISTRRPIDVRFRSIDGVPIVYGRVGRVYATAVGPVRRLKVSMANAMFERKGTGRH
jgi:hypothetical protein